MGCTIYMDFTNKKTILYGLYVKFILVYIGL